MHDEWLKYSYVCMITVALIFHNFFIAWMGIAAAGALPIYALIVAILLAALSYRHKAFGIWLYWLLSLSALISLTAHELLASKHLSLPATSYVIVEALVLIALGFSLFGKLLDFPKIWKATLFASICGAIYLPLIYAVFQDTVEILLIIIPGLLMYISKWFYLYRYSEGRLIQDTISGDVF